LLTNGGLQFLKRNILLWRYELQKAALKAVEALKKKCQEILMEAYRRFPDEVPMVAFWWTGYRKNFGGRNPLGYPPGLEAEVLAKLVEMGLIVPLDPARPKATLWCNPDIWVHWESLKGGGLAICEPDRDPDETQEIPVSVLTFLNKVAAEKDSEV